MLVLLSCGPSSERVISTIKKQIDNVDFHCFSNVDEFINQSKTRRLAFDRIVFTQKFISTKEDMCKLSEYISNYMSSAEVVMLLLKNADNDILESAFKEYFENPLYTLMYVESSTVKGMVDAVTLPIVDVRARYYTLDKTEKPEPQLPKLGLFKGGKKNNSPNLQIQKNRKDTSSNIEKGIDIGKINIEDGSVKSYTEDTSNGIDFNSNSTSADSNIFENFDFSEMSPSSDYDKNINGQNSGYINDDLDLSIGDYGSQHSDSGFVGDDEILELERYANNSVTIPETYYNESNAKELLSSDLIENKKQKSVSTDKPKEEVIFSKPTTVYVNNTNVENNVSSFKKRASIVTGLRGSGASAFVINAALKASKSGKKVLIVDLDYKACGILSFIDVKSFYDRGCNGGNRMYYEDGVDVISNGYDMPNCINVSTILGNDVVGKYDLVLVDCPIDCLSVIPDDVFCNCDVIVGSITDISKLIETSANLASRGLVSLRKEVHIARNCQVPNKRITKDSIEEVKSVMLFPNGCWLDNI